MAQAVTVAEGILQSGVGRLGRKPSCGTEYKHGVEIQGLYVYICLTVPIL